MHYCTKKEGDVEEDNYGFSIRRQSTNEVYVEEVLTNEVIKTLDTLHKKPF
jgi:hypothetical protein